MLRSCISSTIAFVLSAGGRYVALFRNVVVDLSTDADHNGGVLHPVLLHEMWGKQRLLPRSDEALSVPQWLGRVAHICRSYQMWVFSSIPLFVTCNRLCVLPIGVYTSSTPHRSCRCTTPWSRFSASTTISEVIFFCSIRSSACAAKASAEMVRGCGVMHCAAVRSSASLPRCSSKRRRSPSLTMPRSESPSVTAVMPRPLRDIS